MLAYYSFWRYGHRDTPGAVEFLNGLGDGIRRYPVPSYRNLTHALKVSRF
jgi:hypothetical protein